MSTATIDTTAADLKTVLSYADKCRELDRFIDEKFGPAAERLKAAGYPGAAWIECVTGVNPLEGGAIFDNLEAVRIANGQPGVADWLIGRVTNWDTLDEIRGEYEDTDEAAVAAFDRKFASAFPALDSLISSAVREFERSGKNAGRFDPATREKISEALGRSLEDIQADVHKAVATITGAVAR